MVEAETPSAMTGPVPVIVVLAATGVPPIKIAVPPVFETGVRRFRVFTSALVDLRAQVESPDVLEAEQFP